MYNGINWEEEFPNVLERGKKGHSLQAIANSYGVSRERIRQIYKRFGINPRDVGVSLKARQSREAAAVSFFQKHGNKSQDLYKEKKSKFRNKKYNAGRVGIPFELNFGDLEWPTHCPVLGIELDYKAGLRQDNSVSFDRINTDLGYVKGNVVLVSYRANRIKNDGSVEEHRKIVKYYEKFLGN